MYYTEINVITEDGAEQLLRADQRDGQAFALWALKRSLFAPPGRDLAEVMPVVFLRVAAWSAWQRTNGTTIEWSDWDRRTVAVELVGQEAADPTQPAGSGDSSPSSPPEPE